MLKQPQILDPRCSICIIDRRPEKTLFNLDGSLTIKTIMHHIIKTPLKIEDMQVSGIFDGTRTRYILLVLRFTHLLVPFILFRSKKSF